MKIKNSLASLSMAAVLPFLGGGDAQAQQAPPNNIVNGTNITQIYNGGVARRGGPDFQIRVSTNTGRTRLVDVDVCTVRPARSGNRVGIIPTPAYAAQFNPRDVPNPPDIEEAYKINATHYVEGGQKYSFMPLTKKVADHTIQAHGVKASQMGEANELTKRFFSATMPYSLMSNNAQVFTRLGVRPQANAERICGF